MLTVGQLAPSFSLPDQDGQTHQLPNDQWTLVYFYPEDDTPGCTIEACGIRDSYEQLTKHLSIYGISKDSVESHKKFAEKFNLPFPLLADTQHATLSAYGAWENDKTLRISYLINPQNQIAKVYPDVNPAQHAEEILKDVQQLTSV